MQYDYDSRVPVQDDPLRWWEDKQVEVSFPDGRKCRSWVLQSRRWPDPVEGEASVDPRSIGRMTIVPLPEPGDLTYPKTLTMLMYAGHHHGRVPGVRLLGEQEALYACLLRSDTDEPIPTVTQKQASFDGGHDQFTQEPCGPR